jgi:hypothetical protein
MSFVSPCPLPLPTPSWRRNRRIGRDPHLDLATFRLRHTGALAPAPHHLKLVGARLVQNDRCFSVHHRYGPPRFSRRYDKHERW